MIQTIEIELRNGRYPYNQKNLFNRASIRLKRGDCALVWGETGCGKTTLLKIISGIIPAACNFHMEKKMIINGKETNSHDAKKQPAFAFQEPENQFLWNTAEREILFGMDEEEQKEARKIISLFGMTKLMKKSVRDLSAGQRKAVSLISTFSKKSDIILLDEPFGNLDPEMTEKVFQAIGMRRNDRIIVISSHEIDCVRICNRIFDFDHSRLAWSQISRKDFEEKHTKNRKKERRIKVEPEETTVVDFRDVSFSYCDGTKGAKNVNFKVFKGEIIGLIGKNGSGKTTIINMIMGINKPSKGRIIRAENSMAFVMQEPEKQLFCNSVENELFFCNPNQKNYEAVKDIIDHLKINKKEDHPFFLSRGQKQAVLILSVLLNKPKIIIFDEPFTGLDYKTISEIKRMINIFYELYHPTIILADQTDSQIRSLINRAVLLK